MKVDPICCDMLMETVSRIATGKFIDITTYRCTKCESEVVERWSINNNKATQALIDETEERRLGYD